MDNDFSQVIVVKLGGSIFNARETTLADMVSLQKKGCRLVIVHGGAKLVTAWCADLGIQSRFHDGERMTDRKSLDVVAAVLAGLANKETVAAITRAGGRAVGISGVDGGLVRAKVRDAALGYIGEVTRVDPLPLRTLLAAGFMPVVSPVGYNDSPAEGEPLLLNINGDTAAGEIAAALKADKLVYLTDVPGIRDNRGEILTRLSQGQARELISSGVATGGMIPKLKSCLVAAAAGVACNIVDGRPAGALADTVAGRVTGTTIA